MKSDVKPHPLNVKKVDDSFAFNHRVFRTPKHKKSRSSYVYPMENLKMTGLPDNK